MIVSHWCSLDVARGNAQLPISCRLLERKVVRELDQGPIEARDALREAPWNIGWAHYDINDTLRFDQIILQVGGKLAG